MPLHIDPPIVNSSNPWATSEDDLTNLYTLPTTGAVTTRTSTLTGFPHNDAVHRYIYFDARSNTTKNKRSPHSNSTLNNLGYSPIPLAEYLSIISRIVTTCKPPFNGRKKPFIVSVTGTAEDVVKCHGMVADCARRLRHPLYMEINLSCPNIPDKPPPAYSSLALQGYLFALQRSFVASRHGTTTSLPHLSDPQARASHPDGVEAEVEVEVRIGIKTPPYTYIDQFHALRTALLATTGGGMACPITFITATNTLGNCLVLDESETPSPPTPNLSLPTSYTPALAAQAISGIGGLAGSGLHALALGNVATLSRLLAAHEELKHVEIIGTGGVSDYAGYARMRSVGARYVGVGTALGREGTGVFGKLWREMETLERFAEMERGLSGVGVEETHTTTAEQTNATGVGVSGEMGADGENGEKEDSGVE